MDNKLNKRAKIFLSLIVFGFAFCCLLTANIVYVQYTKIHEVKVESPVDTLKVMNEKLDYILENKESLK